MTLHHYFKRPLFASILGGMLLLASASPALAHVTVKPGEVMTATYQVFTVSVPNEKEIPTASVEVLIPEGVTSVTPTNKPSWKVSFEKVNDTVQSITWSDGEIADGFRDEFTFSAKTPDAPMELQWKAYQTYADGTVVAWDQDSEDGHGHGGSDSGPFSVTNVTNDEQADANTTQEAAERGMYLGVAGIVVGLAAVYFATKKK